MRRKDRQKDEIFAKQVFRDCEYATLATVDHNLMPYCIPISPVIEDNIIYFHCATEGKKLENINNNSNVCISCVSYTTLRPERYTTEYMSAVAFGRCIVVDDETEAVHALRLIAEKYAKSNLGEFTEQVEASRGATLVMKISIDMITGKANII